MATVQVTGQSFEETVKFGKEFLHLPNIMRHGGSLA